MSFRSMWSGVTEKESGPPAVTAVHSHLPSGGWAGALWSTRPLQQTPRSGELAYIQTADAVPDGQHTSSDHRPQCTPGLGTSTLARVFYHPVYIHTRALLGWEPDGDLPSSRGISTAFAAGEPPAWCTGSANVTLLPGVALTAFPLPLDAQLSAHPLPPPGPAHTLSPREPRAPGTRTCCLQEGPLSPGLSAGRSEHDRQEAHTEDWTHPHLGPRLQTRNLCATSEQGPGEPGVGSRWQWSHGQTAPPPALSH